MKKISNTLSRINTLEIYSGGCAYILVISGVSLLIFGSVIVIDAIFLVSLMGLLLLQAYALDLKGKIKEFIIEFNVDFDSEKTKNLDSQYVFISDAFPAYWSPDWMYIEIHPISDQGMTYLFQVKKYWYQTLMEYFQQTNFTHFKFEDAQEGTGKFHPEFMNIIPRNFFCDQ